MTYVVATLIYLMVIILIIGVDIWKQNNRYAAIAVIVVTIMLSTSLYNTTKTLMGYPVEDMPQGEFILDHYIPRERESIIHLWIRESYDSLPRAYVIPYTDDERGKLDEAAEEAKEVGGSMYGKVVPYTEDNTANPGAFEWYVMDPTQWLIKE